MSEKIQETQKRLKEVGYFASEKLSKLVSLFESAGKKENKSIPSLFLQGPSGAGKTFLAEAFAKMIGAEEKFVQCFPRMGAENFHKDIDAEVMIDKQVNGGFNAEIMVKCFEFYAEINGKTEEFYKKFNIDRNKTITEEDLKDNRQVIQMGILLQALEQSKKGPVVLTMDELDKSRPEVDFFLLDFLENGRLTTGTETYQKGPYPIYTIITSNGKRNIDEALIDRSRKIEVPRPEKELFLEILGVPKNHYLGYVYDKCQNFSIRKAKQYMEDLETLGLERDDDALSQYINLDELNVRSLADLQNIEKIENLEFDLPDLERCYIVINSKNKEGWAKIFSGENKDKFDMHIDEKDGKYYINLDTVEQLQIASKEIEFGGYDNWYKGWFEYELTDEEMQSKNIKWAITKNNKDERRFGMILDGDKMFDLLKDGEKTFIYLNSEENTIEQFLGQENDRADTEYETDLGYDYDD